LRPSRAVEYPPEQLPTENAVDEFDAEAEPVAKDNVAKRAANKASIAAAPKHLRMIKAALDKLRHFASASKLCVSDLDLVKSAALKARANRAKLSQFLTRV